MRQSYLSGALLVLAFGAPAQTRVDLGNQSRNIDFSGASFVRPFPVGAALPVTCEVGQMFFLTTAPAGTSQCTSTNIWAPIHGTVGNAAATIDVKLTNSTTLTIGSMCSLLTPCLFRIGSSVYSMLSPAILSLAGGAGLAIIYIDSNANLTVGVPDSANPSLACTGCIVTSPVTRFGPDTIPLETWNATSAGWDGSGTNYVALLSAPPTLLAGDNVTLTESGGNITISSTGGGSSGGGGGGGTGGSGSGFNPMDPTQFYRDHLELATAFNNSADGWTYSGGCSAGSGSGATGFSQETVVPAVWGQTSGAGNACTFSFPTQTGVYGSGTFDYWSGAAPAQLWVGATYITADTNGTHYVGLGGDAYSFTDFIGCRQSGAGNWFAVIRAGGVDVSTADTGVAHDALSHRIVADNAAGTANTIRCSVDGSTAASATGTIPARTFGWVYLNGVQSSGATPATFAAFQYTIFLQGLPRL